MPAPSLFCPHKRLVSVCPECGRARAGAATPMRGPVQHDVDASWHRLRSRAHERARAFIERVHAGEPSAKAYWAAFAPLPHRGKVVSEEEDPATFRGGFYRAMVKMFDLTIHDRRIQGYNGLADWEETRDFVLRKLPPDDIDAAIEAKRLLLHGGNCAWPRQQIASDVLRDDAIGPAVMALAFAHGKAPADASDDDVAERLAVFERAAGAVGEKRGALQLASKVLHVLAPQRWPALTVATVPEAGEELGYPIPEVASPRDYLAFADAMRAIARAKGHADLDMTDIVVADAHAMVAGDPE